MGNPGERALKAFGSPLSNPSPKAIAHVFESLPFPCFLSFTFVTGICFYYLKMFNAASFNWNTCSQTVNPSSVRLSTGSFLTTTKMLRVDAAEIQKGGEHNLHQEGTE